ncbi:MAG: MFS transporter [Oscillospiraceae bacterium]|jgi:oligogalacturonide transporter|nr:MFS transporter [Oscillospiraceae bacterium]
MNSEIDASIEIPPKERKLTSAWHIGSYAIGNMMSAAADINGIYYMNFLMFAMKLSPILAGVVTSASRVWDGVTDPLMGLIVDRTRTRFGASRPWLLACILPIWLGYFMLWYCFGIEGQGARFLYFLLAYMFFSTASTIGIVPYEALLPRMVRDYKKRENYTSARSFLEGVSGAFSVYIYELLIPVKTAADYPGLTKNFMWLGFVLGGMFAISPLITFFGAKETPQPAAARRISIKGLLHEYKDLLRSRLYRRCLFLSLFGMFVAHVQTESSIIFLLMLFGNRHYNVFSISLSLIFLSINFEGASNVLSFILNVFLMKKKSKKHAMLVDFPLEIAAAVIFLFITPGTPIWVYFVGLFLTGLGASCLAFIPRTMIPELPDVDELIFGRRREGAAAGLLSLGKKVVQGAAALSFGTVLSIFGLDAETASPDKTTFASLFAVKFMLCIIPIVGCIILFFATRKYNLDAQRHNMIQAKIKQKRASGMATCAPEEIAVCEDVTGLSFDELWISKALTEEEISQSVII